MSPALAHDNPVSKLALPSSFKSGNLSIRAADVWWTTMGAETTKPSLYDRLGGIYAIATVVDDFIDRIMIDPALNSNPLVDEAHHRVGKAGFKYLVTEMVGGATGGPQKYTGRSMRDSHADLKITEGEWVAFCKDFQDTLDKFKVPAAEQRELFAIVQSTKADIVSTG
jgi:hemoglobin